MFRGAIRTDLFRTGGNVTAKKVQYNSADYRIPFQHDEIKAVSKMGNGTVHIGFSSVFERFPMVVAIFTCQFVN